MLRRKIKCSPTLWLIDSIIDSGDRPQRSADYFPGDDLLTPIQRPKGLPIGNQTSQFFANVYLNGFDHFVKETLKAKHYLRYVDDFALFSDDRGFLAAARKAVGEYLASIRLRLHPVKSQLFETHIGANFVGFRILPDYIRVRNDNLRRARRRFQRLQQSFNQGEIGLPDLIQRLQSWEAHLQHGNTYRLRQQIFSQLTFIPPPEPQSLSSNNFERR